VPIKLLVLGWKCLVDEQVRAHSSSRLVILNNDDGLLQNVTELEINSRANINAESRRRKFNTLEIRRDDEGEGEAEEVEKFSRCRRR